MKRKILIMLGILMLLLLILILYFTFKEKKIIVLAYHKVVPNEIKEKYYKDDPWIDTT